ncbi:nuclear transport factor 2 family protein [Nonomuraea typhae]|uniref:nuclear transport factor 2 family protein n=1 Tax=Nonomuraea typhae TaxID=2603600 RepID=UPI001C67D04F|nr:nuclear transport factor 2 family protein [Nonomuraea typhae]
MDDRLAIADRLATYAYAIDGGAWDLLDEVFTPEALLDYTSAGGIKGTFPEVKAWLAEVLPQWPGRLHLIGACRVAVRGDLAEVSASFSDTLSPSRELVAARGVLQGGGWYHHQMVRTEAGWRSVELVEEQTWRAIY